MPYLTRMEIEIIRYISEGRTAGEAAEVLTVGAHIRTRNRAEVLKLSVSNGILSVNKLMTYTLQS
jgi:DNA-binding CsgD family transcriptional regulator